MISLIGALTPILGKVVGNLFPDPSEAARAKAELVMQMQEHEAQLQKAAGEILKTEAASKHWLAANWRPITMLTFVALIVARWFGFAAPELSEAEYIKLWDIVELGLGGYVIGRSVEKVVPVLGESFGKRGGK